jgi:hypothetical protein
MLSYLAPRSIIQKSGCAEAASVQSYGASHVIGPLHASLTKRLLLTNLLKSRIRPMAGSKTNHLSKFQLMIAPYDH